MALKLQVLVVTMAANAAAIVEENYPPAAGTGYVFSIQNPGGAPFNPPQWMSDRADVEWLVSDDSGICRNRNNAIRAASAPLILMADDDLVFDPADLSGLIEEYEARPDADYILWHAQTNDKRVLPPSGSRLTLWPQHYSPKSDRKSVV